MDVECNECGGTDWSEVLTTDYPERRRERDRTEKQVYECESCGAEGRRFVHNAGGPDTFSGAFR